MHIIEIYRSLQGESSFSGLPCTFVRLAGCNLHCAWCDSEYTFSGGTRQTLAEVLDEVARLAPAGLVEVTGGEPMLQERECVELMQELLHRGYTVLLETSGERPLHKVPPQVHKIVDVKCPASGEGGTFDLANLDAFSPRDELKFVLAGQADYEFARDFLRQHGIGERGIPVLFSPAFRKDAGPARDSANCLLDPCTLAEWILRDGLEVRLGLQIHKYIWEPSTKGV